MNQPRSRITMQMSLQDVVFEMSEGNPGAINVIMSLLTENVDPDNALGGLGSVLLLDTFNIYGSNIWILFKDLGRGNVARAAAIVRGCQLGIISPAELSTMLADSRSVDPSKIDEVVASVRARLPNFAEVV